MPGSWHDVIPLRKPEATTMNDSMLPSEATVTRMRPFQLTLVV